MGRFGFKNYKIIHVLNLSIFSNNFIIFILCNLIIPKMYEKWPPKDVSKELAKQLIQKLSLVNSFGYKVITQKQCNLLTTWYSTIHDVNKNNISITPENIKLFSEPRVMFAYLIIGLSKSKEKIGVGSLGDFHIRKIVQDLQRTTDIIDLFDQDLTEPKLNDQLQNCKIIFLSNPDPYIHKVLSKDILSKIVSVCAKKQIYVVIDERQNDLHPNSSTFMDFHYEKMIVIRKIGSIMEKVITSKNLAIFRSTQILSTIQKSQSKSMKILPGDLALKLIQIQMSQKSLFCRSQLIHTLKTNHNILATFINLLNPKFQDPKQQAEYDRYYILEQQKLQNRKLLQTILQYLPFEPIQPELSASLKKCYKFDLRIETEVLILHLRKLKNILELEFPKI